MFKKKTSLSISMPNPCDKGWKNMQPSTEGRICDRCQYEVIDFSKYSDKQLIKVMSENEVLCGRFHKSQLDRLIEINEGGVGLGKTYKRVAAAIAITTASIIGSGSDLKAQSSPTETIHKTSSKTLEKSQKSILVKGRVLNQSNHQPIAKALITEFGSKGSNEILTDEKGYFEIYVVETAKLLISARHYESQTIEVKSQNEIDFFLKEEVYDHSAVQVEGNIQYRVDETEVNKDQSTTIISGIVRDEDGETLIGVNVWQKGSTIGTVTDIDGNYSIKIQVGATLMFTYVGYGPQEILIKNNDQLDIVLEEAGILSGEIVVGSFRVDKRKKHRRKKH